MLHPEIRRKNRKEKIGKHVGESSSVPRPEIECNFASAFLLLARLTASKSLTPALKRVASRRAAPRPLTYIPPDDLPALLNFDVGPNSRASAEFTFNPDRANCPNE